MLNLVVLGYEGHDVAAALAASPEDERQVFLRATWDRELVDRPLLTVMQPDGALPEFRFGMLRAVNFWREHPGSTEATVWRHVERHESGRIMHALYEGTVGNVGRAVPLAEHPETADLAASLSDDDVSIPTGIRDLTAAYVPNMLPNRLHRGSEIGRGDYDAPIRDLFDALDETWTSWMRDIRLARARLIVPDGYLRNEGPGQGASFDDDREVWHSLSEQATATTLDLLNRAGAVSTATKVKILHLQPAADVCPDGSWEQALTALRPRPPPTRISTGPCRWTPRSRELTSTRPGPSKVRPRPKNRPTMPSADPAAGWARRSTWQSMPAADPSRRTGRRRTRFHGRDGPLARSPPPREAADPAGLHIASIFLRSAR